MTIAVMHIPLDQLLDQVMALTHFQICLLTVVQTDRNQTLIRLCNLFYQPRLQLSEQLSNRLL